jgi:hypothetical protein
LRGSCGPGNLHVRGWVLPMEPGAVVVLYEAAAVARALEAARLCV